MGLIGHGGELWILNCGLWIADCGWGIVDFELKEISNPQSKISNVPSAFLEVSQKFRVRAQHHGRVFGEYFPVGFHGTNEFKKFRILVIRSGVNLEGFRITFTTNFLGGFVGLGYENLSILFGFRTNFLRFFRAFSLVLFGDPLPLGLHPIKHGLGILFRQVRAFDSDVQDFQTVSRGFLIGAFGDLGHDQRTVRGDNFRKARGDPVPREARSK